MVVTCKGMLFMFCKNLRQWIIDKNLSRNCRNFSVIKIKLGLILRSLKKSLKNYSNSEKESTV